MRSTFEVYYFKRALYRGGNELKGESLEKIEFFKKYVLYAHDSKSFEKYKARPFQNRFKRCKNSKIRVFTTP